MRAGGVKSAKGRTARPDLPVRAYLLVRPDEKKLEV
jgi:hypothetical protein